jgi:hypothetical protein
MGTGIHGWLEYGDDLDDDAEPDHWTTAVNLEAILHRSYDFFGPFFGVRNYANFEPLAAERGLPPDPSRTVRSQFPEGDEPSGGEGPTSYHSHTWLRLDESIPWRSYARLEEPEGFSLDGWSRATNTSKYTRERELLEHRTDLRYSDGGSVFGDEQFETLKRELRVAVGDYRFESYPRTLFDLAVWPWMHVLDAVDSFDRLRDRDRDHLRLVVWFDS